MNRKQFCSALKLVAAHQAGLSVRGELLGQNLDLPLPQFAWTRVKSKGDLSRMEYKEQQDTGSTDSEVDSETLSVGRNESPSASSTASDSPTPTNSVQDRSWAITGIWQGLVSEEQRQLLGVFVFLLLLLLALKSVNSTSFLYHMYGVAVWALVPMHMNLEVGFTLLNTTLKNKGTDLLLVSNNK